jgi:hypothetical protein
MERFCIYTCIIDKILERIFLDRLPHPTFQPLFMLNFNMYSNMCEVCFQICVMTNYCILSIYFVL